jgi:hypothetical protein
VQFFAPDARVELIEGEVIDMAPIGTRHWSAVNRLHALFAAAFGPRVIVASRSSLRLGTHSEPEPDLGVYKYRRGDRDRDAGHRDGGRAARRAAGPHWLVRAEVK